MELRALVLVAGLFVAVCLPVVVRGAPLADDFHTCVRPTQIGLAGFLSESAARLGAVRPARFLEIFAISMCREVPFGLIILVPLALTLLVAHQLLRLLRDLSLPPPWPEIGAALWLLHPLGAEAALWPSALHVPLGLGFAVVALRLHRGGRHGWGALAALGACLSVEQVIVALPLAAWMVSPPGRRNRAAIMTGTIVAVVGISYFVWPGSDPRAAVGAADRVGAIFTDLGWYVRFPAAGLGLHSIPLAVWWGFPLSVIVLLVGGLVGFRVGPVMLERRLVSSWPNPGVTLRWGAALIALITLVNLPLMMTVPRGHTPRTFTPTWLVISTVAPFVASRPQWKRTRLFGALGGVFTLAALLSLALSVWVRTNTAGFTEVSSRYVGERAPDGALVEVCGVQRTVVSPAPVGSFALHEFLYSWAAKDSLYFYTRKDADFVLSGPLFNSPCSHNDEIDLTVSFTDLVHKWDRQ